MKLLSSNTCAIPADIRSVTQFDPSAEAALSEIGLTAEQKQRIWSAVEGFYRSGVSPAVSICIRRHGHVVLNRALGHRIGNGPQDRPETPKELAQPETPFCMFSASKVITAMLIHKLAEEHKIDLLAPVSHYIPAFGVNGKSHVTPAHILSHRAGIPSIQGDFKPELLFDTPAVVKLINNSSLRSRSGHRQSYHAATGGYVLGELISAITGKDPRQYLTEVIQQPLGFRTFNYGLAEELRDNVAVNYATGFKPVLATDWFLKKALGADLETVVSLTNDPRFFDIICPAANVYATADEACQFFEMMLRGGILNGVRVLDRLTVRRATLESGKPEFDRTLLMPLRYSYGCMLGSNPVGLFGPNTGRAFGHLGFSNIFCWADPQRDISVALLTSGKPIVGPHLPPLVNVLSQISWQIPSVK